MIPTRVFKGQRSVALGLWSTACIGCSQYVYGKFQFNECNRSRTNIT